MGLIGNLRQSIANMFGASPKMYNAFNDAFMWASTGGGYTPYDVEQKTYLEEGYNTNALVFSVFSESLKPSAETAVRTPFA